MNYVLMSFLAPNPEAPVTVPYTMFNAFGSEVSRRLRPQLLLRRDLHRGSPASPRAHVVQL